MIRYLSIEESLLLHELSIHEFGGSLGLMNRERLMSCLETPQQTMFGQKLYPDLWTKAGILFYLPCAKPLLWGW